MTPNNKQNINYLYFSFFLLAISLFSLSYMVRPGTPWWGVHLFFMIYSLGQSLLEVGFFVLIAYFLKERTSSPVFYSFIGLSFFTLLAHYVDFTLLRLMDTSFSYLLQFFLGSGIKHLYTAFLALNMNKVMVGCIVSSLFLVPLVGIGLYVLTQNWTKRRPWSLPLNKLGRMLAIVGGCLFLLDLFAYPWLNRKAYDKYEKALPLGTTFLSPRPTFQELRETLPTLPPEETVTQRIEKLAPFKTKLPNIYFFIIETLRRDFINDETAPILSSFARENISFANSWANANYTNVSWFALLHAAFPHYWTQVRDHYREGSPALRILQNLGYKIRIYSSADLSYFNMQGILFGKENQLIDYVEQYTDQRDLEPCDRDAKALAAFARDLEENAEGTIYLFFLDATHSEYSFPQETSPKFQPVAKQISYLTIRRFSKDLELLQNRYRNAIFYVDSLVGKCFSLLKEKGLYNESIALITGDHAEEFFEEGSLFHGTHLNRYQIAVPIACKMGDNGWKEKIDSRREAISHIDLLPSLIHYLTEKLDYADLFDGESIFGPYQKPYQLAFLQNGSQPPVQFWLQWGQESLKARIAGPHSLEILESSELAKESICQHVLRAFGRPATKDLSQIIEQPK